MDEHVKRLIEGMALNPPTTEGKLREAEKELGISFPVQYKEFMLESNGAEGPIGENAYLLIWPVEVLVQYNEDYKVNEYNPGLVYFGSSGGGMAFAFDNRTKETPIVTLPFISIDLEEVESCGHTFTEFLILRSEL